ncbi:MAG: radical SAM protein [Rhodocyclaceae bacterium]|nr:radical SAM protein [Rhodocyclaceae bacterium]
MTKIPTVTLSQLGELAERSPVLIFGAGAVGELLLRLCEEADIQISGFVDNNSGLAGQLRYGLAVYPPARALAEFGDVPVVVSAADLGDIVDQLQALGFTTILPGGPLLRHVNHSRYALSAGEDFTEFTATTCAQCHDAYLDAELIFLRSVDIVITERCSLKCQDCANLMQYYEKAENCDLDEIRGAITSLCSVVDGINEFRVIGGEPFMNKEIDKVLEMLIPENKVRKIVIYTNGTIIPRHELIPLLADPKVLMLVTDYGPLSPRMDKLLAFMDTHRIAYHRRPAENWTDCARIIKHDRQPEANQQIFRECCSKNTFTLMSGKLFRCPFAANVDRLGAVPDLPNDNVDMLAPSEHATLKAAVNALVFKKKTLDACDYCDGRPLNAPHITPGIQVKQPLKYVKLASRTTG